MIESILSFSFDDGRAAEGITWAWLHPQMLERGDGLGNWAKGNIGAVSK